VQDTVNEIGHESKVTDQYRHEQQTVVCGRLIVREFDSPGIQETNRTLTIVNTSRYFSFL
jgi:hypothetical protein